jgi:hypothetical protein
MVKSYFKTDIRADPSGVALLTIRVQTGGVLVRFCQINYKKLKPDERMNSSNEEQTCASHQFCCLGQQYFRQVVINKKLNG